MARGMVSKAKCKLRWPWNRSRATAHGDAQTESYDFSEVG
jgi:hypothetical protein